ncbi:MAG: type II and III secretion system protein family protein [Pseudomonadota bacterium]
MGMLSKLGIATSALLFLSPGYIGNAQNLMDIEITEPGSSVILRSIVIGNNKSIVVDVGSPASDVVITNPLIADVAVQTAQRMIFRGVAIGQTNAFVFDKQGNQILNLEIRVEPDTAALEALIERHVPDARVSVEAVNSNILLTGLVDSLSQSDQVVRLATAYLSLNERETNGIVNMMQIGAKDQVLLQVRIVEMQRSIIKQLGINLDSGSGFGRFQGEQEVTVFPGEPGTPPFPDLEASLPFENTLGLASSQAFNVAGFPLGGLLLSGNVTNLVNGSEEQSSIGAELQALERIGVVRTLAEPNITALSGEPANFLAGGEFPIPVGQDGQGAITIEFRPFGVGLGFTPIVLSEGRISLRMSTEVSELSSLGAFQGNSTTTTDAAGNLVTTQALTIPALTVRRAETTIEMPSGSSMMIAGLIESTTRQTVDQVPGLKNIPVLGALFRSRDFLNEETELVVIVTPYLVEPNAPSEFRTPDEGFANAGDAKTILFGRLNRLYGSNEKPVDAENYSAPVGFIEE